MRFKDFASRVAPLKTSEMVIKKVKSFSIATDLTPGTRIYWKWRAEYVAARHADNFYDLREHRGTFTHYTNNSNGSVRIWGVWDDSVHAGHVLAEDDTIIIGLVGDAGFEPATSPM